MSSSPRVDQLPESLAQATGCRPCGGNGPLAAFGGHPQGARLEKIQSSPHFNGTQFVNPVLSAQLNTDMVSAAKSYFLGKEQRTPDVEIPIVTPSVQELARFGDQGLCATWLGHSSVLLEIDGMRVLTDPVFGPRTSPLSWVGPKRFHPVPIDPAQLPPIDAIIVSHDHYDHLDFPTVVKMAHRDTRWVTSLGVGAHLEAWGVEPERIVELDWWESCQIKELQITAAPAHHFQGRGPTASKATFWSSFAIRGPKHAVWFSGDSGPFDQGFTEIGQKLGPFDLSLIEIGAWDKTWANIHLGPDNAMRVHQQVKARTMMPVHWGTFNLALHAWDQPICRAMELAAAQGVELLAPMMGRRVHTGVGVDAFWKDRFARYNQ